MVRWSITVFLLLAAASFGAVIALCGVHDVLPLTAVVLAYYLPATLVIGLWISARYTSRVEILVRCALYAFAIGLAGPLRAKTVILSTIIAFVSGIVMLRNFGRPRLMRRSG